MTTIPGWLPVSYAVRAVTAFILGVLMIIFPGAGLMTFILFVGAFVIADGIIALVGSIARQRGSMDWAMLIYGLLGIAVGLLFLFFPTFSLVAFVLAVAAWMVVVGLATLFSSGRWRKSLRTHGSRSSSRSWRFCSASTFGYFPSLELHPFPSHLGCSLSSGVL